MKSVSNKAWHQCHLVLLVLCGLMLSIHSVEAATQTKNTAKEVPADIRLLIDISGSMKKNDPANLRIPAVNLMTELVPDGSKAGIWTFGQSVNNLVRHQSVDDKWRAYAKKEAKKINSVAMFTNIGAVLERASDDFGGERRFDNTHFILLTDGMVDIDKDPAKNATERDRILASVVNRIKSRGAHIHTVALSGNADHPLMEKLAVFTGGQSALAESPEDLTRIFLGILEGIAPSDQVPLEGNAFDIDASVNEFTALIFRGKSGVPSELVGPDEKVQTVSKHSRDVNWYEQEGYDLVTVHQPAEGTWKIATEIAPGSRVTVVSNLQLEVNKLPANFFPGDILPVEASLTEDGKRLTNPEFLALMDVSLTMKSSDGKQGQKTISREDPPEDGIYRDSISKLTEAGDYEVTLLVDGKTFKRKHRQAISLRAPFDFEFSVVGQGADAFYQLVVSPLSPAIDMAATAVYAKIKAPDESSEVKQIELDEDTQRWRLAIEPDKGDGVYRVAVKAKAKSVDGKEFEFSPKAFEASFPVPAGTTAIVSVNEPEESVAEAEPAEEVPAPEPDVKPETEADPSSKLQATPDAEIPDEELALAGSTNWLLWGGIAGGILGLGALIGGFLFWRARKNAAHSSDEEPGEVLTDSVVEQIMEQPAPTLTAVSAAALGDELDFVEEPEMLAEAPTLEVEEDAVDLSMGGGFDEPEFTEPEAPTLETDDEDMMSDIAAAIEAGADEAPETLKGEEKAALDLEEVLKQEEEDDDEEFNLEDFDIGETDDLPDTKDKP